MHLASKFNHLDCLEMLIMSKAALDIQDKKGYTPLTLTGLHGTFVLGITKHKYLAFLHRLPSPYPSTHQGRCKAKCSNQLEANSCDDFCSERAFSVCETIGQSKMRNR